MGKRVLVVASGTTERLAIPHLLTHLHEEGVNFLDVRIPPRGALSVEQARRIVLAAWYESLGTPDAPDKVVVLVDANGLPPEDRITEFAALPRLLGHLPVPVHVTAAKAHLEAWFFADAAGLRSCLGRSLGHVDASAPDEIDNPKNHLRNLLGEPYTSRTAERIASALTPAVIRDRSRSFAKFEAAVRNGNQIK